MRPVFSIDWMSRLAEEESMWANAHQLEQACAEAWEMLCPTDLASFGADEGQGNRGNE